MHDDFDSFAHLAMYCLSFMLSWFVQAFQAWGIHSRSERRALLRIVLTSWRCLVACSKADEGVGDHYSAS